VAVGILKAATARLFLSRAAERAPEVDDTKRQAEVKKGVLSAELFRRHLSLLEAALIFVSRALLLDRSLSVTIPSSVHRSTFLH
jgi:hypothetical protein